VDYEAEDLERVRALAPHRVLITPNHPTNDEPALLFHLSCAVGQPFFFLACREAFDPAFGLWGHVIRRVGAFSVVRGTADRASFRATRELLARPGAKVVAFPEGEVYSQNDTLLPFHPGIFQLAFWALEDLRKAGDPSPIFVLPVAIKYRFTQDMRPTLLASVERLERFNGLTAEPDDDPYRRLRRVCVAMLRSVEREYRLPAPKDEDMDANLTPRIDAAKEAILLRVATAAGVALPKGETLPERMRSLIHVIETVTREEPSEATPYDRELHRQQRERALPLLRDLRRLSNYIALYDGYVREKPTPERMADTLQRLERESFGRSYLSGPRRCRIRVGEPLDLGERYAGYQAAKRAEVARVTHDVEAAVGALLQASS
jgi:1-acyl-sn-glycerol-3-phosphate acyltransferase